MKNLIVIMGTIILGTIIFELMVGSHDESLKSATIVSMKHILKLYGELQ